ncbi:hypothetical protein QWY20_04790 [Alkalimonas sp. MEB108]|uniref:Uncharacterized protein n=1 Tax=Alkalimonas cellulosilytica TaxID=3058395 RepID=A0ABU7J2M5_9GAMM|nr:hypothetical protein [Alkalimonas sp. MEB108]MEE2000760.1 hypothetical protein [Alkalimonas sp. MEB108]
MKWSFWLLMIIGFVFINENIVHWLLAIKVGGYSISDGYTAATRYFTWKSFLFSAYFRAIPYLILALVAVKSRLRFTSQGKTAIWFALAALLVIHFLGYWGMQYALYTPDHISSTASLAVIFIPFHATLLAIIGAAIGYALALGVQSALRRAS